MIQKLCVICGFGFGSLSFFPLHTSLCPSYVKIVIVLLFSLKVSFDHRLSGGTMIRKLMSVKSQKLNWPKLVRGQHWWLHGYCALCRHSISSWKSRKYKKWRVREVDWLNALFLTSKYGKNNNKTEKKNKKEIEFLPISLYTTQFICSKGSLRSFDLTLLNTI